MTTAAATALEGCDTAGESAAPVKTDDPGMVFIPAELRLDAGPQVCGWSDQVGIVGGQLAKQGFDAVVVAVVFSRSVGRHPAPSR